MANKIQSKGSSLLMEISSVYTAFPQLKSFSIGGAKSETYSSKTLDGPVTETHDPTGYASAAEITADFFYDPDDAVQSAFKALITAPVATNFKTTFVDATPHSDIYSGTGFGMDTTVSPTDGLSGSLSIMTSGDPS